MEISALLANARLDLRVLSERSGISRSYLKQFSSGARRPSPEARLKIANALREHAAALEEAAKHLQNAESRVSD